MNEPSIVRSRVLCSALACDATRGSEATVGAKYAEILARNYDVTIFAAPPSRAPPGTKLVTCNTGPCNLNDVDSLPLLRFELAQLRKARSLAPRYDIAHRVTPAAIGMPSLLPLLGVPFILGPLIAAPPPPMAFAPVLRHQAPARRGMLDWSSERLARGLSRRVIGLMDRSELGFRRADLILVGMEEARRQVPEKWRDKCVPITWSGIEHEMFHPPDQRPADRPLRLLFVGRLVPYKGVELLLRAVARARTCTPVQLSVLGSGPADYEASLRDLTRELGISELVDFEPSVSRSELVRRYQQAHVFCFPTLADTYGVALLEAMSSGCAVIVSDTGGPGEIVKRGEGIKVPLVDPERYIAEFADAIVLLATNASLREELGARARKRILADHDWPTIGDRLLAIYTEFTSRRLRQSKRSESGDAPDARARNTNPSDRPPVAGLRNEAHS